VQPILYRRKEVRPEIMNIVQENHADEIVTFKNGYFLTQPAFYVSRRKGVQGKVNKLNEYLYRSGKQQADNEVVNWFHTVGKAPLYVTPNDDVEVPFKAYALDPRSAFVVYSLRPGNEPVMGVNFVVADEKALFDVYTERYVFHLRGVTTGKMMTTEINGDFIATATDIVSVEPNVLGYIPIIEYRYNSINTGAFELVLPLLDAINNIQSNRIDGVEQFIQSLAIAVNCQFDDGTTANDIRKAGMIVLKSVGENKADFKILSEQLDQQQTQTLVDYIYSQVQRICAMPFVDRQGRSYDSTGAAALVTSGWFQADAAARNTEDLFRKSNRQFDRIIVEILRRKGILDIDLNDFDIELAKNETANIQSKAQAFQTLMAAGFHPELAAKKSGVSNDPVSDIKMSEKYIKMIWGDPDKADAVEQQTDGQGEAQIVEQDADNGEDTMGGAV
jgi:SPP1 family phage portal protein